MPRLDGLLNLLGCGLLAIALMRIGWLRLLPVHLLAKNLLNLLDLLAESLLSPLRLLVESRLRPLRRLRLLRVLLTET